MERIKELETLIDIHNEKYWKDEDEDNMVSDETFDGWIRDLERLDPQNIRVIGSHGIIQTSKRKKVKRNVPMLSLDKVYNIEDLIKWCEKVARSEEELFLIQPKLDGISADFTNYVLTTKGDEDDDGLIGIDISDKIPIIIAEIDDKIQPLSSIKQDFRGEIVIRKSTFQKNRHKLLRKDGKPYKIERGATVGITMQDDVNLDLTGILSLVSFDKYSMSHTLSMLKKMSWEYLIEEVRSWDFPTDGLVIKLADENYAKTLGVTKHHVKYQIALKYTNPSAKTKLIDVIWQVGKNSLTPIGCVNPIILAGAEIRRVSLHNSKFIIDKDIHINDEIIIERSGEIIPHVVSVIPSEERKKIIIEKCPNCGSSLEYIKPELVCTNYNCKGKLLRNLVDAVKRVGIENLGEPTIEKMINVLNIESLSDIFNLTKEDISQLDGFAKVSINNLFNEINRVRNKTIEDYKFLAALNIKGIGLSLSKQILSHMTLEELYDSDSIKLNQLPNIGIERAMEIKKSMFEKKAEMIKLAKILTIKDTKGIASKKKICFTGKSSHPRNYWINIAEEKNYTFENSVNKNTDLLVTNNVNSNSSKMNKARNWNVRVITYEEFLNL